MFSFYRYVMQRNLHKNLRYFYKSSQIFRPEMDTKKKLLSEITVSEPHFDDKVTIIGAGKVGIATAYCILIQNISHNIILMDGSENLVMGETLDLQHASTFLENPTIETCTDYTKTANSKVCVITAGARQKPGESRLDLLQRNVDIFKDILPNLVKHSPNTILLIVTNPVDILTYASWKISKLSINKVIGSGTNLDSSRFRFLLSQKFEVSTFNCHAYVVGEHGDSSVALWSSVDIAGVRLRDINPNVGKKEDKEKWYELHTEVVKAASKIIKYKGYTSWAVGLSCAAITRSLLRNPIKLDVVTTNVNGYYGMTEDIFFSVPCLLGVDGLNKIVNIPMDKYEMEQLNKSAEILFNLQKTIQF